MSGSLPCVAVTGATGFVGQNLLRELCARGLQPRALSRDPARLQWARLIGARAVRADVFDRATLAAALSGVQVAYYLVHSMEPGGAGSYVERDRRAARNFAEAAREQGVSRIIYLGGLGRAGLSKHLASRAEVGEILTAAGPPVTIVGAGIIVGAGSASFQMLRDLTNRLPAMITPRWVQTRTQPVALDDVIRYLSGLLDHPETAGQRYDIGAPEVFTYAELIRAVAAASHRRPPLIVPVPVLTPRLSSYWVNLVTSVPRSLARPLIEGLSTEAVAIHPERLAALLGVRRTPVTEAIALALGPAAARSETCLTISGGRVRAVQRVSFPTNLLFDRVGPDPAGSLPAWLASVYLAEVACLTLGVIRPRWRDGSVRLALAPFGPALIRLRSPATEPRGAEGAGTAQLPLEGGLLTEPRSATNPGLLSLRWSHQQGRLQVEADLEVSYRPWLLGSRRISNAVQTRMHRFISLRGLRQIGLELARTSVPAYRKTGGA